jgi:hypothetical protein
MPVFLVVYWAYQAMRLPCKMRREHVRSECRAPAYSERHYSAQTWLGGLLVAAPASFYAALIPDTWLPFIPSPSVQRSCQSISPHFEPCPFRSHAAKAHVTRNECTPPISHKRPIVCGQCKRFLLDRHIIVLQRSSQRNTQSPSSKCWHWWLLLRS